MEKIHKKKNSTRVLYFVREAVWRLNDEQWYDDSIIEFCLKKGCEVALLEGHSCLVSQWDLGKVTEDNFSVLSTFLIPKVLDFKNTNSLMPLPAGTDWILGGNYSLCEFLVVPINFERNHWSLGIVWLAPMQGSSQWKRCILYLDSLSSSSAKCPKEVEAFCKKVEVKCGAIRTYLNSRCQMSDANTTDNLPVIHVKVPQQSNFYDCGLMVLHYAILFITCPNKRALARDLIDGKKENWFGCGTRDEVSEYVCNLRKSVRTAILLEMVNLKPLTTDESKTTVGRTTSDGIVELLSEEEESDEKEGSISRRQLENNSKATRRNNKHPTVEKRKRRKGGKRKRDD